MRCWIYRHLILGRLEANASLSDSMRHHIEICPKCREYYRVQRTIGEQLTSQAVHHRATASPFLSSRITASLSSEFEDAPANVWCWRRTALASLALGAVLAATIVLWPTSKNGDVPARAMNREALRQEALTPVAWPDRKQFGRWTESVEAPLETEWRSMVGDTKTIAQSLAKNFLPVTLQPLPAARQPSN